MAKSVSKNIKVLGLLKSGQNPESTLYLSTLFGYRHNIDCHFLACIFVIFSIIFLLDNYCVNICLVRTCSVSINSCKSESVKLSPEATLKVTNGQNSCTGWASACIKHQEK